MEKICMIAIYFREFVYNNYLRVISICKRIHNKASIIFLSSYHACSVFNAVSLELVLRVSCYVSTRYLCIICGCSLSTGRFPLLLPYLFIFS